MWNRSLKPVAVDHSDSRPWEVNFALHPDGACRGGTDGETGWPGCLDTHHPCDLVAKGLGLASYGQDWQSQRFKDLRFGVADLMVRGRQVQSTVVACASSLKKVSLVHLGVDRGLQATSLRLEGS